MISFLKIFEFLILWQVVVSYCNQGQFISAARRKKRKKDPINSVFRLVIQILSALIAHLTCYFSSDPTLSTTWNWPDLLCFWSDPFSSQPSFRSISDLFEQDPDSFEISFLMDPTRAQLCSKVQFNQTAEIISTIDWLWFGRFRSKLQRFLVFWM